MFNTCRKTSTRMLILTLMHVIFIQKQLFKVYKDYEFNGVNVSGNAYLLILLFLNYFHLNNLNTLT